MKRLAIGFGLIIAGIVVVALILGAFLLWGIATYYLGHWLTNITGSTFYFYPDAGDKQASELFAGVLFQALLYGGMYFAWVLGGDFIERHPSCAGQVKQ